MTNPNQVIIQTENLRCSINLSRTLTKDEEVELIKSIKSEIVLRLWQQKLIDYELLDRVWVYPRGDK